MQDLFKSRDVLKVGKKKYIIFRLDALEKAGLAKLNKLPFSIRIVLEAAGLVWRPLFNVGKRTTRATANPDEDFCRRWNGTSGRLISAFLEQAGSKAAELKLALGSRDWPVARSAAHWMKSSSAAVGAMQLSELCQRLEIELDTKDFARARNLGPQKRGRNLRKYRAEHRNRSAVGCDAVRPEEICRARYRAQQLSMREADLTFSRDIRRHHGQGRPVRMQSRRRFEQMVQIARGNEGVVRRSLQCLDIGNRRNAPGESRRERKSKRGNHCPCPSTGGGSRPEFLNRRRTPAHPPVSAGEDFATRFALDTPERRHPLAQKRKRVASARKRYCAQGTAA